jgi:hypothetical protein
VEVLQNSCNPGFVKLGQILGKDKLFSYIDKFGFGEKNGIDLNGGYLYTPYVVSDVVGKSLDEAKKLICNFTVITTGEGHTVLEQTPAAGEKVEDMSKVRLLLG